MRTFFFVFILLLFPLCGAQYACSQSREALLKYWGERGVSFEMEGGTDPYVLKNSLLPLESISVPFGDFELDTLSDFFDDIEQLQDGASIDLHLAIKQESDCDMIKTLTGSINKYRTLHVVVSANKLSSRMTSAFEGIVNLNQFVFISDGHSTISKECIMSLSQHKNLMYLGLPGRSLTDSDLEPLAKLQKLRGLRIYSRGDLTGSFLCDIPPTFLVQLRIGSPKIGDEIFKWVTRFQSLERLVIFESAAKGNMLDELSALKKLRFLSLQHSPIGGVGLLGLQKVESLEDLVFTFSPISDADVKYLKQLSNIKRMRFYKCDMTESGVNELKSTLKNTEFEHVPKE